MKTILSKLKGAPDPYFGITYNMNLYRGCQHQCIYCDSRSDVYGVGDFSRIRIKKNALELLENSLRKLRSRGTIGTGSMNDPYMPIESKEKLVQRALKIIEKYRYPVHILTKSNLVLRDTDVIRSIADQYAAVSFTITTTDDELSKKIEPGAPNSTKRFNALNQLAKHGIYTGIILTPVLPYITDNEENIKTLIQRAHDNGAQYILGWIGMTQRKGQREYYYRQLRRIFPGVRERYIKEFGNQYSVSPSNAQKLYTIYKEYCSLMKIPRQMHFYSKNKPTQFELFT